MTDLTKCPKCGGEADNGHDRCSPPNVYLCNACANYNYSPNAYHMVHDFVKKMEPYLQVKNCA